MGKIAKKKMASIVIWLAMIPVVLMLIKMRNAFISDTDFFWHIELGKEILQTKSISHTDTLSWITEEQSLPFINHSWISDILLYLLSEIHGYMFGAYLYGVVTMFLLGICLYVFWANHFPVDNWGRFRPGLSDGVALAIISWAVYETRGNPRPQQISVILFVVAYHLLKKAWKNQYKKANVLLPLLATVWANVHGGTLPILFVITAMYLVLSLLPDYTGRIIHKKRGNPKQLAGILAAEIAAGCINPYGPILYSQLYRVSNTCAVLYVTEWQPASMNNAAWVILSMFIFIGVVLLAPWKITLEQTAPVCIFAAMTMLHVRAYPWYAVCLAVFVLEHTEDMRYAFNHLFKTTVKRPTSAKRKHTFPVKWIVCTLCAGGMLCGVWISVNIVQQKYYREFSEELTTVIQTIAPQRMYTSYNSGGMAIEAGFKSFVDSRADAFTQDILKDASVLSGNDTSANSSKISDVIEKYAFDAILIAKYDSNSAWVESYLSQKDTWICVFSDTWYSLYAPASDTAKYVAEYISLNNRYNENDEAYTKVYPSLDVTMQYVTPADIVSAIQNQETGLVFFTDAYENQCREIASDVQEWAQQNGYDSVYVCNIKQYRMEYGYDNTGKMVVTKNRTVGYDELLEELNDLLPYYQVKGNGHDLETVVLDVKTINAPTIISFQNGVASVVDLKQ